ncbi:tyrosine-type recombinase/integrase [Lacinutrix iliipiscaria]|uniref:Tyrosine-type recombinase/integrase n=1 Tax=Lacinutrix iliipiscaria TaxID=1230532 RepID=A0ABW5WR09_9FLAO
MKILEIYIRKLRNKRYSENTIDSYVSYLQAFIKDNNIKDPYQVSLKQITSYLENRHYSSVSQQNQIIGSLKLFAKYILGKKAIHLDKIERPRKSITIQPVIPRDFLLNRLTSVKNIKHKTIITLGYACGLRVSEIINLQWKHINRQEQTLLISQAKGNKDRLLPINDSIIDLLEQHARSHKPQQYVFTGQDWRPQYSASSCNNIVKATFGKQYRFHSLRKSCGVHLFELGNNLALIQDLYGHSNIKTTRIYVSSSLEALRHLSHLV